MMNKTSCEVGLVAPVGLKAYILGLQKRKKFPGRKKAWGARVLNQEEDIYKMQT
jgi:hypothetical protein